MSWERELELFEDLRLQIQEILCICAHERFSKGQIRRIVGPLVLLRHKELVSPYLPLKTSYERHTCREAFTRMCMNVVDLMWMFLDEVRQDYHFTHDELTDLNDFVWNRNQELVKSLYRSAGKEPLPLFS